VRPGKAKKVEARRSAFPAAKGGEGPFGGAYAPRALSP
jgi:hypothetical protein